MKMNGVILLVERKIDSHLGIRTIGIREWSKQKANKYNRYEATPYKALDKLFQQYKFKKDDYFVDFGSGRGRVSFYIHHKFKIPVTGVEANDKTYEEALKNEASYLKSVNEVKAPIRFDFGLAEQYEIDSEATCFYFFNPFTLKIFKKVINNILKSFEETEREIDLIVYYPLTEFKKYLREETGFELINKISAPGEHGSYGKFIIYRLRVQDEENHFN